MKYDQPIADHVLNLLRKHGWTNAISILRNEIESSESETARNSARQCIGWLAAERGEYDEARLHLRQLLDVQECAGWGHIGLGFIAARSRNTDEAERHFKAADALAGDDLELAGGVLLYRGALLRNQGQLSRSLPMLERALELLGPKTPAHGRVLDALGAWYAASNNLKAALDFYQAAIRHQEVFKDEAGLAVTCGQLGRLYLDWGQFDLAHEQFQRDLEICRRICDERGAAQMSNFLGFVCLELEDVETAEEHLHHAIEAARNRGWTLIEAFAQKDLARCQIATDRYEQAMDLLERARDLFEGVEFRELGLAYINLTQGILLRQSGDQDAAEDCLKQALEFFRSCGELTLVAIVTLEYAKTLHVREAPHQQVYDAFVTAVVAAETARRPHLLQRADEQLAGFDRAESDRRLYQRVRGTLIDKDATSLISALKEVVTVFFFDLQGFTKWSQMTDPAVVLLSLNQMMAEFEEVTTRHNVQVIEYMGDGFLALSRGPEHARRAVQTSLELTEALERYNHPNQLLRRPADQLFRCRIGISTGEVVLGNVGTYSKIDYRAVGTTVNLAARLEKKANPGKPCVSDATWNAVQEFFEPTQDSPRTVELKGLGDRDVWDVDRLK